MDVSQSLHILCHCLAKMFYLCSALVTLCHTCPCRSPCHPLSHSSLQVPLSHVSLSPLSLQVTMSSRLLWSSSPFFICIMSD